MSRQSQWFGPDNHSRAEQIFHKTSYFSAGVPAWYYQGIGILLCLFYSVSPGQVLILLLAMINAMIFRVVTVGLVSGHGRTCFRPPKILRTMFNV